VRHDFKNVARSLEGAASPILDSNGSAITGHIQARGSAAAPTSVRSVSTPNQIKLIGK
jgi:hypothetical protein